MTASSSERNPVDKLAEEFAARHRRGEHPSLTEYTDKYPQWADEIRELFPALVLMEQFKPRSGDATGADVGLAPAEDLTLERLGDYRILREIGRGGMGIVYEAEQVSLGRHVALKVLPAQHLLDPRQLGRFQREAKAAARLHHTNIVPVYGVGEANGLHYYVMQFIQGQGLDQVLGELRRLRQTRSGSPAKTEEHVLPPERGHAQEVSAVAEALLTGQFASPQGAAAVEEAGAVLELSTVRPTEEVAGSSSLHLPGQPESRTLSESGRPYWQSVARVGIQVAEALAYAHNQGTLHRDIKPSNLLVDTQGTVWITDFGLAKATTDQDNLTHTGDIVGTLRYMAPERFEGQADARSDLYALGLTLYELLTLRPAFDEAERHKLASQVMHTEPPRPRKLNPLVPRDLETVVLKTLARDPAHRYQTASELAEDLKRFVDDRPIRARRVSARERFWRWCRRNPALAWLTGAVAALLLTVAVTSTGLAIRIAAARNDAVRAQHQAEANAEENRELIGRQYVSNGLRLMDQGDLSGALLWFAEALQQDANDPERAELHRLRLGTLLRECPRPAHVWFHEAKVNDAAYSPDGRWLVTACDDQTARVWDAATGAPVAALAHDRPVQQVQFSSDGRRLLTVSGQSPSSVSFGQNLQGEARVWDPGTGKALTPPLKHTPLFYSPGAEGSSLSSGPFSADGSRLWTFSDAQTVQVWQTETGQPAGPALKHELNVTGAFFSPDGRQVFTLSSETRPGQNPFSADIRGEARMWDVATGRPSTAPQELREVAWGMDASPDGRRVVTCNSGSMRVWEVATGRPSWWYARSNQFVGVAKFSPDSRSVVLSTTDQDSGRATWRVADAGTGQLVSQLPESTNQAIGDAAFSPDGRRVLLPGPDNTARVWEAASGLPVAPPLRHEAAVLQLKFSPDGRRVLSVSADNAARVWEASTGLPMTPLLKHDGAVSQARFSPDGLQILTLSRPTARIWPVAPGSL
jgi:serine/threonine protein kinase/WD40 repeat protein